MGENYLKKLADVQTQYMTKLEIAKQVIKQHFESADCGLFDTRNLVGDPMTTIYSKDGLQIDICYRYRYFEVFGLDDESFEQLARFYKSLQREVYESILKEVYESLQKEEGHNGENNYS